MQGGIFESVTSSMAFLVLDRGAGGSAWVPQREPVGKTGRARRLAGKLVSEINSALPEGGYPGHLPHFSRTDAGAEDELEGV